MKKFIWVLGIGVLALFFTACGGGGNDNNNNGNSGNTAAEVLMGQTFYIALSDELEDGFYHSVYFDVTTYIDAIYDGEGTITETYVEPVTYSENSFTMTEQDGSDPITCVILGSDNRSVNLNCEGLTFNFWYTIEDAKANPSIVDDAESTIFRKLY